ncbi:MAG: succinyldiaminopimelate transaminase [Pseudomonadaceae bacterium]|nr:succinyldiaminopimelate transaminase [Pseudomonadaceae bacterium]
MTFNLNLKDLQPYPFERLRQLTDDIKGNSAFSLIPLTLGEPKHAPPQFVVDALTDPQHIREALGTYPLTKGSAELRTAIGNWLQQRFGIAVDPEHEILPVNGTREGLFAFAQAMLSGKSDSYVMMPNPFYQIYEGAALLAGAQPLLVDNQPRLDFQQDFEHITETQWQQTELVYLCSPGNPTGQIMPEAQQQALIERAHKYNFIIAADECYSELYFDETQPPGSLLSASKAMGNPDFSRCVVFHSLSKRSNLPGLRSGFVAGDKALMAAFLAYRTYHGCAMSAHHQAVSRLAWQDEAHVIANRQLYQAKFAAVRDILAPHYRLNEPDGAFYHWLATPADDRAFARELLQQFNVLVMPGQFLARSNNGHNPGSGFVRVAWVAPFEQCVEAAERLARFAQSG